MRRADALEILEKHDIHPSVQRIAIMDYLLKNRTHPTVEEVYVALSRSIPTLSKTTVYNTLRLFYEMGAAQMLTIDEAKLRFDGDVSSHAHFFCKQCGAVYDVMLTDGNAAIAAGELAKFQADETHIYIKGICESCQQKNNKEENYKH